VNSRGRKSAVSSLYILCSEVALSQGGTAQPRKGLGNARGQVVVSFARHGRSRPQSFPRKRESTPQTFGNALSTDWIPPALAGRE
jgi:hypothetical protein